MTLKKQEFKDDEIPIFDEACVYKRGEYWQFRMWLTKENKYARKSLRTRSETTALERGKAAYLEIYANLQQGKTYFSITTKEGVQQYVDFRKRDVELGHIVSDRLATISTHLQHWLSFIGKDTKLKELERTDCENYFYHRQKSTDSKVKQVTVQNEQSTINACIKWLNKNGETHIDGFDFKKLPRLDKGDDAIRRATLSSDDKKDHVYGQFESLKFDHRRKKYREYTEYLENSSITKRELIENIGAYIGDMSLNRLVTLSAYFDMTKNIAGHIADVGTYKGASALLFAKLMKIYNPESTWQVHGFDWFKGIHPDPENDSKLVQEGGYLSSEEELRNLIVLQNLDPILRLHNLDIVTELDKFLNDFPHLQFRLVFMDVGLYEVMDKAIPLFWSRLTIGGIMVFDQLSHEFAPGEISAVRKHLPNEEINTLPNSWMPNAFIKKQRQ